jgi:hypothetical protein
MGLAYESIYSRGEPVPVSVHTFSSFAEEE